MRSPVIMIIAYLILSLVADFYIYMKIRKSSKGIRTAYWVQFSLLNTLLIVALCLTARGNEMILLTKMWLLFAWLSLFSIKFVYVIFSLLQSLLQKCRIKAPWLGKWIGIPLGVACCIMLWIGALSTRKHIEVLPVVVQSDNLPAEFDGFTIAQISDLHLGTWGSDTTFVSSLVDSVNYLHPDLIVFTGDIVNRHTPELFPFKKVLKRLKAPYGVVAILGNHDYGMYFSFPSPEAEQANMASLKQSMKEMNWNLLCNQHITLHHGSDSIILIGVENWGEPPFNEYGDLQQACDSSANIDASGQIMHDSINPNGPQFKILLTHNPEHWRLKARKESNINLTLSGHTHGMQMEWRIGKHRLSPAVFRYPLWGGLYLDENNKLNLYVNIGAGCVGLPFRLGSSVPEITYITLYNRLPSQKAKSLEKIVK